MRACLTIAVVGIALAFAGRRPLAVVIAASGLAPIFLYGVWSMAQGWYFLPNSVLLKGNVPDPTLFGIAKVLVGWNAANALQMTPHLLVLLAAGAGRRAQRALGHRRARGRWR